MITASIGLILWLIVIVSGLILEAVAIRMGDTQQWPTLTRVIKEHAPKWILAPAIGWLAYHFLISHII